MIVLKVQCGMTVGHPCWHDYEAVRDVSPRRCRHVLLVPLPVAVADDVDALRALSQPHTSLEARP